MIFPGSLVLALASHPLTVSLPNICLVISNMIQLRGNQLLSKSSSRWFFFFFIMSNEGLNESYFTLNGLAEVFSKSLFGKDQSLNYNSTQVQDLTFLHSSFMITATEAKSILIDCIPLGNLTGKLCTRHTIQNIRITGNSIQ